jgi:hypothetical protein
MHKQNTEFRTSGGELRDSGTLLVSVFSDPARQLILYGREEMGNHTVLGTWAQSTHLAQ